MRFAEIKSEFNLVSYTEAERVITSLKKGKQPALKIEELRAKGAYKEIEQFRPEVDVVNSVQETRENEVLERVLY